MATVRNPEPMQQEIEERPSTYYQPAEPIAVKLVKDETAERKKSATFGGLQSYRFVGTETVPQQLLRFDERRDRAVIQGLPGFVTNNTQGNLWIGSRAQVANGNPSAAGAILVSGQTITIESASEVWCVPDGTHELTVTVLDETFRT